MRNREENGPLSQLYGKNNNNNKNFNPNNLVNTTNNNYNNTNNQGKFFSNNDIRNISINNPNNNQILRNNNDQTNIPNQSNNIKNVYDRNMIRRNEPKQKANYNINDDYELINTYVRVNQQKLLFNTKNIYALIFGEFYMFYRKLYIGGALLFIVKLLITLYLHWLLALLLNLIPFFLFNKYYVFVITNQIKSLKEKYKESKGEIYTKVEKAGGVNYIGILIGFGIEIGITLFFFLISLIFGFSSVFDGQSGMSKRFVEPDTYDGTLQYNQKVNISSRVKITIPKELNNHSNKYSYNAEITIGKNTVFNRCEYTLQVVDNYRNLDNLTELMSEYYEVDYSKRTINRVKWNHIVASKRGSEEIFLTKKGGHIYIYRFKIGMDADFKLCKEYNEEIVSSLKFK